MFRDHDIVHPLAQTNAFVSSQQPHGKPALRAQAALCIYGFQAQDPGKACRLCPMKFEILARLKEYAGLGKLFLKPTVLLKVTL